VTAPGGGASNPTVEDDSRATTLGAVLIGVAVLIGFVLLLKGFDQEGGVVETGAPAVETTTTTSAVAGPGVDDTTTTTTPERSPAEVNVVVANGSGGTGQASQNKATLTAAGYTTVETTNAPVRSTSVVYFAEGWESEAAAVAEELEIAVTAVTEMPASPPVPLGEATVLVIIGADKV
jgi:hypothetical protein